jgi:hypothetical protein
MKTVKKSEGNTQFIKRVMAIASDQVDDTRALGLSLITLITYLICVAVRVCNNEIVNNYRYGYDDNDY